MGAMASHITSLAIVYSPVHSDADQRKHQSSVSLAFVRGIHRWPVNSPHKWQVTRKMFPFDDVIMFLYIHRIPWSTHTFMLRPVLFWLHRFLWHIYLSPSGLFNSTKTIAQILGMPDRYETNKTQQCVNRVSDLWGAPDTYDKLRISEVERV